ncbi:SMC-Scp complex subunit ScpB [Patescibacteria group bacterium]
MNELSKKIEAILFYQNGPTKIKNLAAMLSVQEEDALNAVSELKESLSDRGIRLIKKDDVVMIGTAPEFGDIIEALVKEELNKDLGKAGLETLAIVLYLGPIAKSRVDYIRGVNSGFILRNLMVRGLVERTSNPEDQRSFLYKPTFELFAHLGITDITELPDYENVKVEIESFEEQKEEEEEVA